MSRRGQFLIRNDLSRLLILNIEPEGAFVPLAEGEEVSVIDDDEAEPVTVKLSNSARGEPILSIWPGDGDVRVEKDGVNVLDLNPKGAEV
ncbi:MAG TPA: hypothetical protein VG406_29630 [Isosphaeraceae bacterium]|jgi:hypothetical protein|nr:hypothetical protein [Isosphaeraceae bacterium]